ncbi:hypothetical protein B0H16DRAFT_181785 [Mycena metata]|uniref:Uncharacterized protein n=1 Tax=Mycena metata TaxID=1033252 RepID=A0AAD7I0F4_9AGAR|nr:hypothetical protein B0H16DRAFT_181785 [Mycena metata]
MYSTGFIIFRIRRVGGGKSRSDSRLMSFLVISVESAALQTVWLIVASITQLGGSDVAFIGMDTFPAIVGISNTLIHARVGLGWSRESAHPQSMGKSAYRGCCLVCQSFKFAKKLSSSSLSIIEIGEDAIDNSGGSTSNSVFCVQILEAVCKGSK